MDWFLIENFGVLFCFDSGSENWPEGREQVLVFFVWGE